MTFDAWKEGKVAPSHYDIGIVAPLKLEPVSAQLKGELIYPNKTAQLSGIRFSPDGKQLIAGSRFSPDGKRTAASRAVVVWDVASGNQLCKIDGGPSIWWNVRDYFFVASDWKTVFITRLQEDVHSEKDDFTVETWELATGKLLRTCKTDALYTRFSHDRKTFVTAPSYGDGSSGVQNSSCRLWDVTSAESHRLPNDVRCLPLFSPDNRSLAVKSEKKRRAQAVGLCDAIDGKEKWSTPLPKSRPEVQLKAFSPDSRQLAGLCGSNGSSLRELVVWDVATGHEVAAIAADKGDKFHSILRAGSWTGNLLSFSPDGNTLAAIAKRGDMMTLLLYRHADKEPSRFVALEKYSGSTVSGPVFSPEGKWVVAITQVRKDGGEDYNDYTRQPQYRIHLIDVAAGKVREVLIAPQGFASTPCFSPDGKTLATGSNGRVLLWDVGERAGEAK